MKNISNEVLVVDNGKVHVKKPYVALILVTVMVFLLGFAAFRIPAYSIYLDINPSIEIRTNRFEKVISVNAKNKDAENILSGYNPKGEDLDDVIEDIIDRLILGGYFEDNTKDILVTVNDGSASDEKLNRINKSVVKYIKKYKDDVNIHGYITAASDSDKANAKRANVSLGKYMLSKNISGNDQELMENLLNMSISEIIEYCERKDTDIDDIWKNKPKKNEADLFLKKGSDKKITAKEAGELALKECKKGSIVEIEDDGRFYEVTIRVGDDKYEYDVDSLTSKVYLEEIDINEYKKSNNKKYDDCDYDYDYDDYDEHYDD